MSIPEILLLLAEIAAAKAVVNSSLNVARRGTAVAAWQAALKYGPGAADQAFNDHLQKLHEWRKAEIAKAVAKVRASFGVTSTTNHKGKGDYGLLNQ